MPIIKIDGKDITVEKGTTILNAALQNGIFIPHFCYHPALSVSGNCRICLVEVEKQPKLCTACSTVVADNMVVHTNTPKVKKAREGTMEFLLLNHPLDCPECDKAGECMLQNFAFSYSSGKSRLLESKVQYKIKDIGKSIYLWTRRCILCSRCIRFCREISGTNELGFIKRGIHTEIEAFPTKRLNSLMSCNTVDICPVGALIDKDFLHKARVWHFDKVESICPFCSMGCNIYVHVKENKIFRIKPRYNPEVNSYWICDIGRHGYHYVNSENRIKTPQIRIGDKWQNISYEEAIRTISGRIKKILMGKGNVVAGICSSYSTNEDAFILKKVINLLNCNRLAVFSGFDDGNRLTFKSGFTIDSDKSPNTIGTCQILELGYEPSASYKAILRDIAKGEVRTVIYIGGEPDHSATKEEIDILSKLEFFIAFTVSKSSFSDLANIIIPCEAFVEKEGTFTNKNMRVQKLSPYRKITTKNGITHVWKVLNELTKWFDSPLEYKSEEEIFTDIAKEYPKYNNISYPLLADKGFPLP